ncbi:MAG: ribosome-binding factor A [Candidatus Liptonbacteria bacterium]
MNHRSDRVQSVIQEELGKILQREVGIIDVLITITAVEVDKKLETAKVKIGVIPQEKDEAVLRNLKNMQGKLQHLLNIKMNIKPMPRINLEIDRGAENAARVEKLLIEEDLREPLQ